MIEVRRKVTTLFDETSVRFDGGCENLGIRDF